MTNAKAAALGVVIALLTIIGAGGAGAENYPARPIQVIVPFAGGSASDVVTRILLDRAAKSLGEPFIVDNRPGAGGNTGTLAAVRATPDGYTIVGSGTGPVAANKTLYRDLGYDPEKDLEPVSMIGVFPIVVTASARLPVNTLAELIAYAKDHPGLNYGSVGIGSSQHLSGAYFEQLVGLKLTHVPYRNIAQYTPDLMAGTVQLGFQWLPNVTAAIKSGGAKALAVAANQRMTALPEVPTTVEAGLPAYQASGWFMMLAPKGTPKEIVARLNQELNAAMSDPAVRARITEQGAETLVLSPQEVAAFLSSEVAKWRDIIHKAGIEPIQ